MAKFNINEIRAQAIGKDSPIGGYVTPSLCLFTISPPVAVNSEALTLLASNFNLPGISLNTDDIRRQGFGPQEFRVTGVNLGARTINVNFFLDRKGNVMKFIQNLMSTAATYDATNLQKQSAQGQFFGEVGYFDDYKCQITLETFAPEGDQIIEYNIQDAFLFNHDDIQFGWNQINEISTVTCQFRFRGFTTNFTEPTQEARLSNRLNLFQFIAKYKGAVEVVKSLKKPQGVQDALNVLNNGRTLGSLFD